MLIEIKTNEGKKVNGEVNYNELIEILSCRKLIETIKITMKAPQKDKIIRSMNLEENERFLVESALSISQTQKEAAKVLGITERVLCYKIKQMKDES